MEEKKRKWSGAHGNAIPAGGLEGLNIGAHAGKNSAHEYVEKCERGEKSEPFNLEEILDAPDKQQPKSQERGR